MPTISACMIVLNAEKTLALALESLENVYEDLIIVDGGSTDSTCDIASHYGARIIHSEWSGDFSEQRNLYLREVKTDWVFIIDADEFVDNKTVELLRVVKDYEHKTNGDRFYIMRRWISPFSKRHYIGSYPYNIDWQDRLFYFHKNLYYKDQVHERLVGHCFRDWEATVPHIYHLDLFLTDEKTRVEKVNKYRQKRSHNTEDANYLYLPNNNIILEEWNLDEDINHSVKLLLEKL